MNNEELKLIRGLLLTHGVIAFPTETVMGLGVLFDDYQAYIRLNEIKRRPEDKPYTMMVASVDDIEKYAYLNERNRKICEAFFPGPLTVLLPARDNVPCFVTHNTGVIGIRIPNKESLLELLKYVNIPLLVPSANISGDKPALNTEEVKEIFGDQIDYIIEGSADGDLPSTILDLTKDEIAIIRQGSISIDIINNVIGETK